MFNPRSNLGAINVVVVGLVALIVGVLAFGGPDEPDPCADIPAACTAPAVPTPPASGIGR